MKHLFSLFYLVPLLASAQGAWIGLTGQTSYMTNVVVGNCASGDVDIFACPANSKMVVQNLSCGTTNASSVFPEVKTNGVYYPIQPLTTTVTTNALSVIVAVGVLSSFVFVEGETFAINSNATGVNAFLTATIFPSLWKGTTAKLFALAVGENTLYTCPANTKAIPLHTVTGIGLAGITPLVCYVNRSGGNRVIKEYLVKSGSSTGTMNRLFWSPSVAQNALLNVFYSVLEAGDSLVIDTDSAADNQTVFVGYYELPVP